MFEVHYDLDILKLKQQTADDHRNAEGAVALMHHGLNVAQYIQCLQRIYGVVAAWEERATDVAPQWLQPALIARHRKHLLELDLAWLGVTGKDEGRPTLPEMSTLPGLLGTMYVMEGSTLGGQFIARHVEAELHFSEGQGSSYFRGHGNRTGPLWKEFCGMLTLHIADEQTDHVVISAKAMFSTFGTWMHRKSAMDEI